MVTIKDVAKATGVDPSTVSRVINNDANLSVKPETRRKILEAAKRLNYRSNAAARSLKTGLNYTIGMVIPDVYNPVYREIYLGADEVLSREGYYILSVSTDDQKTKKDAYLKLLSEGRVDGVILASSLVDDAAVQASGQNSIPIVEVNRSSRLMENFVVVDDQGAAKYAVEHLIQLGHRRIAHLSGPLYTNTALERFQGYRLALQGADIAFTNSLVIETDFSENSGYNAMKTMLQQERPTAVFAANIRSALGAIAAVKEAQFKIPGDISIICLHDLPFANLIDPPLTTVKLPLYEMGKEAAEILLRLIRKEDGIRQMTLPGYELILRGSTGQAVHIVS